jgi:hypothetical protein
VVYFSTSQLELELNKNKTKLKNMFKNTLIQILVYINLALICYCFHLKYRLGEFQGVPPKEKIIPTQIPSLKEEPVPQAHCELIPQLPPPSDNHAPLAQNSLTKKFDKLFKGKLAGKGASIIQVANQYNIDPKLLAAICVHESAYGVSRNALLYNNVTGSLKCVNNKWVPRVFNSVEDCFIFTASNLKRNYIDQGLKSVAQIGRKYCPVITDRKNPGFNDPNNLNSYWVPAVSKLIKRFEDGV